MLDALELLKSTLPRFRPSIMAEIGSGSGVVSAFMSQLYPFGFLLSLDVSVRANEATKQTLALNSLYNVDVVTTDLFSGIRQEKIDLVVFNPPYVQTSELEFQESLKEIGLKAALSGGTQGMKVIQRVLDQLESQMAPGGIFLLLVIEYNDPIQILKDFKRKGWTQQVSLELHDSIEYFYLYIACRSG